MRRPSACGSDRTSSAGAHSATRHVLKEVRGEQPVERQRLERRREHRDQQELREHEAGHAATLEPVRADEQVVRHGKRRHERERIGRSRPGVRFHGRYAIRPRARCSGNTRPFQGRVTGSTPVGRSETPSGGLAMSSSMKPHRRAGRGRGAEPGHRRQGDRRRARPSRHRRGAGARGDRPRRRRRGPRDTGCPTRWPGPRPPRCAPSGCSGTSGARRHDRRVERPPTADGALRGAVHQRLIGSDAVERLVGAPAGGAAPPARRPPARGRARCSRPSGTSGCVRELADEVAGLGPLEPLLADPVGHRGDGQRHRRVLRRARRAARAGRRSCSTRTRALRIVERVIAPLGLRLDRASPMVDARLPDGSRLHAVIPPLAIDGPCVTIRRFGARRIALDAFGAGGDGAAFLRWAVAAGWNVLVSGGTSSGKTTLLNALSGRDRPERERIVTIEETAELRLRPAARRPARGAAGRTPKAPARCRCGISCAPRCACDRTGSSSARCAAARRSTCCRRSTPGTTARCRRCTPTARSTRCAASPRCRSSAGLSLPFAAIAEQVAAAVDVVVQVERGRSGAARIVDDRRGADASDGVVATRSLLTRGPDGLVPVGGRRPVRCGAGRAAAGGGWFSDRVVVTVLGAIAAVRLAHRGPAGDRRSTGCGGSATGAAAPAAAALRDRLARRARPGGRRSHARRRGAALAPRRRSCGAGLARALSPIAADPGRPRGARRRRRSRCGGRAAGATGGGGGTAGARSIGSPPGCGPGTTVGESLARARRRHRSARARPPRLDARAGISASGSATRSRSGRGERPLPGVQAVTGALALAVERRRRVRGRARRSRRVAPRP